MTETNDSIVLRPCEYKLFVRVRVAQCHGLLIVGLFKTERAADEWDTTFRHAAQTNGAEVSSSRLRTVWPGSRQILDFDCKTEDGLPWEAAAHLYFSIPRLHRLRRLNARQRRIAKFA